MTIQYRGALCFVVKLLLDQYMVTPSGNHDASMIKHLIQVENYMSFVEVIESYKQPLEL